jgi:UDP-N-acetylmuramyl pentapeptide synthase
MSDEIGYTLHLTPPQLKVVHTALKSLLDDFGHDEAQVARAIHEVLDKLPDEHSIRAISIQ